MSKSGKSPTELTLAYLRKNGFTCAIVEKWNAHARIRQDLFGFGDVLAVHPELKIQLLVQCTSTGCMSARRKKAKGLPGLKDWLLSGCKAEVWGFDPGMEHPRRREVLAEQIVVVLKLKRKRKDDPQGLLWGGK